MHACWCLYKLNRVVIDDLSTFHYLKIVVNSRWSNTRLSGPWVDFGAGLAGAHVTHTRFVPKIADFWVVAAFRAILFRLIDYLTWNCIHNSWTYLIVALEWLEGIHSRQWRWITNPLKCLPVCDDVNILHSIDGVEEFNKAFFVVRLCEPCGMIKQTEWSTIGCVMTFEVFEDHLIHAIRLSGVRAGVTHRAASTIQVLPHHHRNLPDAGIAFCRAWRNHAIMEEFVVERVWPAWWSVFVDRHRRVISEIEVVQHLKHSVSTNWQERRAHAANIFLFDTSVGWQDLTLTGNFACPFLQWELFTETMTVDGWKWTALKDCNQRAKSLVATWLVL